MIWIGLSTAALGVATAAGLRRRRSLHIAAEAECDRRAAVAAFREDALVRLRSYCPEIADSGTDFFEVVVGLKDGDLVLRDVVTMGSRETDIDGLSGLSPDAIARTLLAVAGAVSQARDTDALLRIMSRHDVSIGETWCPFPPLGGCDGLVDRRRN